MPILRHRLLADTQNETPHDIDHLYRLLSKQTRSSRLDQNVPGTCVYLQPYLNTQEGKYACILNYGLIVGTFHFLFNDILVMCLSNTYCHHAFLPHSSNPPMPGQNTGRGQTLRAASRLSWRPGSAWTRRRSTAGGTHEPLIAGAARGRGRGPPPGGAAGCCSSARWRR